MRSSIIRDDARTFIVTHSPENALHVALEQWEFRLIGSVTEELASTVSLPDLGGVLTCFAQYQSALSPSEMRQCLMTVLAYYLRAQKGALTIREVFPGLLALAENLHDDLLELVLPFCSATSWPAPGTDPDGPGEFEDMYGAIEIAAEENEDEKSVKRAMALNRLQALLNSHRQGLYCSCIMSTAAADAGG